MKVCDLIELLEYCPSRLPMRIALVDAAGAMRICGEVLFLQEEDQVVLVALPEADTKPAENAPAALSVADYERPQLFGHRHVLLRKAVAPPPASA